MNDDLELDRLESSQVPARTGELLDLIDDLIIAVEGARNAPLSSNVRLDREAVLDMLYRIRRASGGAARCAVDGA